jgi:hypothetical protein
MHARGAFDRSISIMTVCLQISIACEQRTMRLLCAPLKRHRRVKSPQQAATYGVQIGNPFDF